MTCQHSHLDGSYVLGALSPAERLDYEHHLSTCPECARAVRELAGLPGLLARVDADALVAEMPDEPVPPTLLPALVGEVRRSRRRHRWYAAGLAAAAVLVVLASLGATGALGRDDPASAPLADPTPSPTSASTPTSIPARSMEQVRPGPVTATVSFTKVAWGTRLDVLCTYSQLLYDLDAGAPTAYALVVTTREGRTEQIATWRALPGRTMQLSAATATRRADIASVEVRTAAGDPVLRLAT